MKTNQIVIGTLSGIAIGAILGVLFAPDKGTNTRKKILIKGSAATKDLKGRLENITSSLSDKYNSLTKNEAFAEQQKGKVNMQNIKKINKALGS